MTNIFPKKLCIFKLGLILLFISCKENQVDLPLPTQLSQLPNEMHEISGILNNSNNTIFAHNDSGDSPTLYEINLTEQKINRTIALRNADALDWEDIAEDDESIYIGDFGNNLGGRENLVIYKTNKNAVAIQDSVNAENINFHFEDQTDFTLRDDHNFDCEAMIIFENQIYLFTKNRADFQTNWYALPTSSGDHTATLQGTFNSEGLITGATINQDKNVIALLGYSDNNSAAFIWLLYNFPNDNIFNGKKVKIDLELEEQTEAIAFENDKTLLFAEEKESNGGAAGWVYRLEIEKYFE